MDTPLFKAKMMKYCKPELSTNKDFKLWQSHNGFNSEGIKLPNNVMFWDFDNFEGFYFLDNNKLYIYFNGTNELSDWFDNFNAIRMDLIISDNFCGQVHKGFYNYYENVRESFLKLVNDNINVSEIHITGYSLGGSCVIGALEASFITNCPPITVVTFGSPRIGNLKFTNTFKNRIHKSTRLVNDHDPVPKVPLPIRFQHVHELNLLQNNTIYTSLCKRWFHTMSHFFIKSGFIECHALDNYIEKLQRILI